MNKKDELRMHQIGLEIQNEELRRSQAELNDALHKSEEQLSDAMENAPDGVYLIDIAGNFLYGNRKAEEIIGYSREEIIGKNVMELNLLTPDGLAKVAGLLQDPNLGKISGFDELTLNKKDGNQIIAEINISSARCNGQPVVIGFVRDITERKLRGAYGEMSRVILQFLNEPGNPRDSIQRILSELKTRTGFDAVDIRLQDGDDFPYFARKGFCKDFPLTENTLIERTSNGGLCRDIDGKLSQKCPCAQVISGKTDPANPLYTPGGSFWTNDSFSLLDIPSGKKPLLHSRLQCIHQGYASMALVPIRNKDRVIGLIQLNDRRKGCFTLDTVELLEGIALHIGAALTRKQAEDALRRSEENLRTLLSEKEVLLKEVHHRVKNNLASITGLADMQRQMINDEPTRAALAKLSSRIRSMALVHEQFYKSKDFSRIDFQKYLDELTAYLRSSFERSVDIHVSVAAAGVEMSLDCAVPCGLFITELVTNAIKHAFPPGRLDSGVGRCEIAVSAQWNGADYTLTVADNGMGLPADLDWTNTGTLGLLLVKMLGQHQLQGRVELDRTRGTTFRLRFAPPKRLRSVTTDKR